MAPPPHRTRFHFSAAFPEELVAQDRMRVADAWDIGQVVVRGPSWNSSDLGMFDGGEGYLGYTSLPSEDQVKEWLAYMLFGSTRNSERPCSITGWFMEGAWINRNIVGVFPSGGGQHVFMAGQGQEFQLNVVQGMSLMSDVDRFIALSRHLGTIEEAFDDWLPKYMANADIILDNTEKIRDLRRASVQWVKDGIQQKLNEKIGSAILEQEERNKRRVLKAQRSGPKDWRATEGRWGVGRCPISPLSPP